MIKPATLDRIIKAYDIRGLVGSEINEEFAFAAGSSFARFIEMEREPGKVVIGEDMRPSSQPLADAFSDGINSQGLDVIRNWSGFNRSTLFRFGSSCPARCNVHRKS